MEEKEVGNEEIKEEEKDKEKNNPPKRWKKFLIVGVIALIIIAAGVGIWYFFIREKDKNNINSRDDKITENKFIVFQDEHGKKINVYYNDYNYPLEISYNNKKEKIIHNRNTKDSNDIGVIFGEHFWYLLSYSNNTIISYYENDKIKNVNYLKHYSDDYYIVYYKDNNRKNIVLIADEKNGTLVKYDNDFPTISLNEEIKDYFCDKKQKTIYLYTDKTAMILNNQKTISKHYDSILHYLPKVGQEQFGIEESGKLVVRDGNKYLILDLYDSLKVIPTDIFFIYEYKDEYLLEIYKYNNKTYLNSNWNVTEIDDYVVYENDEKLIQNDNEIRLVVFKKGNDYYAYTDLMGPYEIVKLDKVDKKDDKYINYTWSVGSCCGGYNIIVDKHTNKIITFGESNVDYIKLANGYYFVTKPCALDEGSEYYYTEDFKELGAGVVNAIDEDENIYVHDDNYIYKYDVHGNELFKSQKYEYINNGIIINKTLYFLAKENNNLYLINLNSGDKVEIVHDIQDNWNLAGNISYKDNIITIEEFRYNDGNVYEYNLTTKTVTKVR